MSEPSVRTDLQANYANYYSDGDSEWRRLGAIDKTSNVVDLCGAHPHDSLLEIGAGEGSLLKQLSDRGFARDLYALEISESGVRTIKGKNIERLRECGLFDGYRVPYESGRFDVAVLSHVVEHVEHPRLLIAEAARVAKLVFVEVPLEDTLGMSHDFVLDDVGHINFYSPNTIRYLLQSCGLQVLSQRISGSSREVYRYQRGAKGVLIHAIKRAALAVAPSLAVRMFSYHSSLLCRPRTNQGSFTK